jgi:hypothetical protein
MVLTRSRRGVSLAKTRTPPSGSCSTGGVSRTLSVGVIHHEGCCEGSAGATFWAGQRFRSRDQLCFSRRLVCLFARAGSVSATPRATTSWPSLITSQYQCPSSSLGIMRNSTPFAMVRWARLRPEMTLMENKIGHYLVGCNQDVGNEGLPSESIFRPQFMPTGQSRPIPSRGGSGRFQNKCEMKSIL